MSAAGALAEGPPDGDDRGPQSHGPAKPSSPQAADSWRAAASALEGDVEEGKDEDEDEDDHDHDHDHDESSESGGGGGGPAGADAKGTRDGTLARNTSAFSTVSFSEISRTLRPGMLLRRQLVLFRFAVLVLPGIVVAFVPFFIAAYVINTSTSLHMSLFEPADPLARPAAARDRSYLFAILLFGLCIGYHLDSVVAMRLFGVHKARIKITEIAMGVLIFNATVAGGLYASPSHDLGGFPLLALGLSIYAPLLVTVLLKGGKDGARLSFASFARKAARRLWVPIATFVAGGITLAYIVLVRELDDKSVMLDIFVMGILFPVAQYGARLLLEKTLLRLTESLDRRQTDEAELVDTGPIFMLADIFLTAPGFLALFLTTDSFVFYTSLALALGIEVVEIVVITRAFSMHRAGVLPSGILSPSQHWSSKAHKYGRRGRRLRSDVVVSVPRLASIVAHQEQGEKVSLLVMIIATVALLATRAGEPDATAQTLSVWTMLERGVSSLAAEALADLCKEFVCARVGIWVHRVRMRLTWDHYALYVSGGVFALILTGGSLCFKPLAG